MSAKVRLGSKLPGGEEWNGLDHYAPDIVDAMRKGDTMMLGCWVVLDAPKGTVDVDAGTLTPSMRVRQIEVITTDGSVPDGEMRRTVEKAFYERTGKMPLPLDEEHGGAVPDAE